MQGPGHVNPQRTDGSGRCLTEHPASGAGGSTPPLGCTPPPPHVVPVPLGGGRPTPAGPCRRLVRRAGDVFPEEERVVRRRVDPDLSLAAAAAQPLAGRAVRRPVEDDFAQTRQPTWGGGYSFIYIVG